MNIDFYRDVSYEYLAGNVLPTDLQLMLASATIPANLSITEGISIQNVPEEVFLQVFCKLSLAELSQVRCVCKQWHTIENGRLLTLIALVALVGKEKLREFNPDIHFLLKCTVPKSKKQALSFLMTPESRPLAGMLFKVGSICTLRKQGEPFIENIFKAISTAASLGCGISHFVSGMFYLAGSVVEKNIDTALQIFQSAVKNDHNGSINYLLSNFYKKNEFYEIPPDQTLGKLYLKAAAEKGLPIAQYFMAQDYLNQSDDQSHLAINYLHNAWEQGYKLSGNLLYHCYLTGTGVPKNPEKAREFLVGGAEGGSGLCKYLLGEQYQEGLNGFEKNANEALKYFQQAGEAGYCLGWEKMCNFYALGIGVPKDQSKAEHYFKLFDNWVKEDPSKKNSAEFLVNIAKHYESGVGVERDLDLAMYLYALSAEEGFRKAYYYLATYYEEGDFVPHDAEKMMDHYKLAADAGCTKAQYKMCQLYTQGFREILPDVNKASECFNTLMANNAPLGKPIALAYCYAFGFGTEIDHEKSILYFHEAADKENYAAAHFRLCMHYADIGENEKACVYFNLLSEELHGDDTYRIKERYRNISFCYANGIGVQQNTQMATLYDQKAEATQCRFFPGSYL